MIVFPLIVISSFPANAVWSTELNASVAIFSTSTYFLSNAIVNSVSPSGVHPSSKPNIALTDFPAKSPAVAPNSSNSAFNSSSFSCRFSLLTSTVFVSPTSVTVFTPYSSSKFSITLDIPAFSNTSDEFILLSNNVTSNVFPVLDTTNLSVAAV